MTLKQKSNLYFGLGIVGLIGTTALTIWADRTVKAHDEPDNKWKRYIPYAAPFATGIFTIAVMSLNQQSTSKEMTRLAGVAGLAATQLSQYKGKVREIADDVADKVEEALSPAEPRGDITPLSDILAADDIITCYDALTGVTFESTVVEVLEAELDINRRFSHGEFIEINDWLAHFDALAPPEFNGCGWELGSILKEFGACWIDFSHKLSMMGDVACNVIEIKTPFVGLASKTT